MAKRKVKATRKDDLIAIVLAVVMSCGVVLAVAYPAVSYSGEREGRRLEIEHACTRLIGDAVRLEDGRVLCLKRDAVHWVR